MMTRESIVECARGLLGVEWVHMGRNGLNGSRGIDCAGVLCWIAHQHGMPYEDHVGWYDPFPDGKTLTEDLSRNLTPIEPSEASLGDVIVFWVDGHPKGHEPPQHIALIVSTEPLAILHSTNKLGIGKVVQHRIPPKWVDRITEAYRFPGVE